MTGMRQANAVVITVKMIRLDASFIVYSLAVGQWTGNPLLRRGGVAPIKQCHATLESARRGRSDHSCESGSTFLAAPISEGSESSVRSARPPLLEGGDIVTQSPITVIGPRRPQGRGFAY